MFSFVYRLHRTFILLIVKREGHCIGPLVYCFVDVDFFVSNPCSKRIEVFLCGSGFGCMK
jgi:hypothetical protein